MTPMQRRFALAYSRCKNGTEAAIEAGAKPKAAGKAACAWLKLKDVRALVDELEQRYAAAVQVSAEKIIRELAAMAFYDAGKIVQMRRSPCQLCHQDAREEHRAAGEQFKWRAQAVGAGKDEHGPDEPEAFASPDPDCPNCSGEGVSSVWIADTRDLERPERSAIVAISESVQGGLQVKLADRAGALEKLMRHLGMFEKDKAPPADPVLITINGVDFGPPPAATPQGQTA